MGNWSARVGLPGRLPLGSLESAIASRRCLGLPIGRLSAVVIAVIIGTTVSITAMLRHL
jgi:hypothetical protein